MDEVNIKLKSQMDAGQFDSTSLNNFFSSAVGRFCDHSLISGQTRCSRIWILWYKTNLCVQSGGTKGPKAEGARENLKNVRAPLSAESSAWSPMDNLLTNSLRICLSVCVTVCLSVANTFSQFLTDFIHIVLKRSANLPDRSQ